MMQLPSHRLEAPAAPTLRAVPSTAPLLVRALRGEPTERRPVWLMRQAGRYLPGYRRLREHATFLEMCGSPDLAAQISLEPVERFGVDAAIVFSDILVPLQAMGMALTFDDGAGPRLAKPVREARDVEALREFDPRRGTRAILATIEQLVPSLPRATPVIGFAGAPFTLATYAVEGRTSKDLVHVKTMMRAEPRTFSRLVDRLGRATVPYLVEQARSGARALQVFDTWAGALSRDDWEWFALPALAALFRDVRRELGAECPPLVLYAQGVSAWLERLPAAGADAYGVDWRLPLGEAKRRLGGAPVQGNLDPTVLLGPADVVRAEARRMLDSVEGDDGVVANLGHGVLVGTPPENVAAFVEEVRRG